MNQPNESQLQAIKVEIQGGQKIAAIKLYREATGVGLKEAKDAVEVIEKDLRQREPEKFSLRTGKSGCLGVLAVGVLLISAAMITIYILRS